MRIINRIAFSILVLLSLIFPAAVASRAQSTQPGSKVATRRRALDPLTPTEQALAERIARSDGRVKEILGDAGVRLVSVIPVLLKAEVPEKTNVTQRQVEVVLFQPQRELGARVIVNLSQNGVVEVSRLASDQVRFTDDDLSDAFQMAMRDPEVLRVLGAAAQTFRLRSGPPTTTAAAPANTVGGLPVRSTDPNDPCSKHRCLWLMFRRGNDYLSQPNVTVDLTDKHVYVEKPVTDRKADH
jgi:hypothetical protein